MRNTRVPQTRVQQSVIMTVIISDDKCTRFILKLSINKVLLTVVQYFVVDYLKLYNGRTLKYLNAVSETLTAAVRL